MNLLIFYLQTKNSCFFLKLHVLFGGFVFIQFFSKGREKHVFPMLCLLVAGAPFAS